MKLEDKIVVLPINGLAITGIKVSVVDTNCDLFYHTGYERIIFYAQNRLSLVEIITTEEADLEDSDEVHNPETDDWEWVTWRWHQNFDIKATELERIADYAIIPEFDEMIENYIKKHE